MVSDGNLRRRPRATLSSPQIGGGYFGILMVAKNILEILERADEILRGVAIDTREELESVA
jgi:hypothetical protein